MAKFFILMNSRYALLSAKIVTEETDIDYRRGGGEGGGGGGGGGGEPSGRADRDRIITLRVILFSVVRVRSLLIFCAKESD